LVHDALADLEALACEAALDQSLWPEVAEGTRAAFRADHVRLAIINPDCSAVLHAQSPLLTGDRLVEPPYLSPKANPELAFSLASPPLAVATREGLDSDSEIVELDFYNEIMRPLGHWHAAVVNMHRGDGVLAPMGLMRTREQGAYAEPELQDLRRLAPRLNSAVRVTIRLRELEAQAGAAARMSDHALVALVLTDGFGRVAEANGLARSILAEGDGLVIRYGILGAVRGDECAWLARLTIEAAGGACRAGLPRSSGVMQVSRPSGRRPLALVVTPTRTSASRFGRSHAVSIAFTDPERTPKPDADLLTRIHGLTAREAAVAALLVQGHSPNEAAEELAMTENTVRTHIRHAFDKTGVERLADFVRLLMQGPGVRGG
jgi:DNA-binding CsgD family transcriptional regulator